MARRWLVLLCIGLWYIHNGFRRLMGATNQLLAGFAERALSVQEKHQLETWLYNQSARFRQVKLFDWEAAWYTARLPEAPARILLGGCGAGRELVPLLERSYQLEAFEPAPRMAEIARQRSAGKAPVLELRYDQWSDAIIDGPSRVLDQLSGRYDAVILGWGSLTHVFDLRERQRLFEALQQTCPTGPILASFWMSNDDDLHRDHGRGRRLGAWLGSFFAPPEAAEEPTDARRAFDPEGGFSRFYSSEEIEALARSIGRELIWEHEADAFPHCTFVLPASGE